MLVSELDVGSGIEDVLMLVLELTAFPPLDLVLVDLVFFDADVVVDFTCADECVGLAREVV